MTYKISNDRKTLTICVDEAERQELREIECISADATTCEFLEPLTCNSELEWINPADTGDLTDAPMLGICESGECYYTEGRLPGVLERWAFMDYQVRSVLEDLRDKGEAVFIS